MSETERVMEAAPPSRMTILFTVEGSGDFPTDMLRYDGCTPVHEGGEDGGGGILTPERHDERIVPRRVRLRSWKGQITEERWRSFGWRVLR